MSSEDDFIYEEEFYRNHGGWLDFTEEMEEEEEEKEFEPTVLKEIVVMSATVNDLYKIFFGIEGDKEKSIFWRDIETNYCLFWYEASSEQEPKDLPRISIYDWRDAEGKQKDKDFPYSLDPAGKINLLQEPEGLHIWFEVMYSRPNFSLISFVENRINRINRDKEVKVIYSYIDQNDLDDVFRSNDLPLTISHPDVLFIDSTATPSLQKEPEQKELEPWEQIPDHYWDREALQMWWNGLTYGQIGLRVSVTAEAVGNRISILRRTHGEMIVPKNEQRKKNRFRKSHDTT